jgi:ADP-heptose:LPS heptosyltransferase
MAVLPVWTRFRSNRWPAVNVLARAWPNLRFDVLAFSPGGAQIFHHNPAARSVHCCTDPRAIAQLANEYSALINLRIANRRPFLKQVRRPIIQFSGRTRTAHKAQDALNFIRRLLPDDAAITEDEARYRLYPQPADHARADDLLAGTGGCRLVGIHLGCASLARYRMLFALHSRLTHRKVWPADRFAEVAWRLTHESPATRMVVLGSNHDQFLSRALLRRVPDAIDLVGKLSVLELAAVMSRLSLFISNDTGPMHIACAMCTPLIGLFGPTNPQRTGPFPPGPPFIVVRRKRMSHITVDEVFDRATEALAVFTADARRPQPATAVSPA